MSIERTIAHDLLSIGAVFLRPDDPFYGDSYNNYDLFGKNDDIDTDVKTVMAHS